MPKKPADITAKAKVKAKATAKVEKTTAGKGKAKAKGKDDKGKNTDVIEQLPPDAVEKYTDQWKSFGFVPATNTGDLPAVPSPPDVLSPTGPSSDPLTGNASADAHMEKNENGDAIDVNTITPIVPEADAPGHIVATSVTTGSDTNDNDHDKDWNFSCVIIVSYLTTKKI